MNLRAATMWASGHSAPDNHLCARPWVWILPKHTPWNDAVTVREAFHHQRREGAEKRLTIQVPSPLAARGSLRTRSRDHRLSSHISSHKMCLQGRQTMSVKKTNILLDEKLVETAKELTGARFTKDVIDLALRRLVRNLRRRRILRLAGKVKWEGDLSTMRRGRRFA
jgi:Arc/MetJ family transcription regulator